MKRKSTARMLLVFGLALSLTAAACGTDDAADPQDEAIEETDAEENDPGEAPIGGTTVAVTTLDFEFQMPDTLPAGEVTFQLVNSGKQPHMFSMVLFTEDAPPVADIIKMPQKKAGRYFDGDELGYLDAKPGKVSEKSFTAELESGRRYGYVCFFETKGKSHAQLGMFGEFKVD